MIYPESPLPVRIKIILSFLIAIFKISASPVYTSVSEDYKHQITTSGPFDRQRQRENKPTTLRELETPQ